MEECSHQFVRLTDPRGNPGWRRKHPAATPSVLCPGAPSTAPCNLSVARQQHPGWHLTRQLGPSPSHADRGDGHCGQEVGAPGISGGEAAQEPCGPGTRLPLTGSGSASEANTTPCPLPQTPLQTNIQSNPPSSWVTGEGSLRTCTSSEVGCLLPSRPHEHPVVRLACSATASRKGAGTPAISLVAHLMAGESE